MERRIIFALIFCLASIEFVFCMVNLNEGYEDEIPEETPSKRRAYISQPTESKKADYYETSSHRKNFIQDLKYQLNFQTATSQSLSSIYYKDPITPLQDIVLLLDRSGGVSESNFTLEKRFIESFIGYFPKYPSTTRVAALTYYSTSVYPVFDFNEIVNEECLEKKIETIQWGYEDSYLMKNRTGYGYTNHTRGTGVALEYALNQLMFNPAAGARENATKMLISLVHGRSNTGVKPEVYAAKMRDNDVASYVIGVTEDRYMESELKSIAGEYSSRVLYESDYGGLYEVVKEIYGDGGRKYHSCTNGQTFYDECGRRCELQDGKLIKCCRLRKEFTDMSCEERIRYVNTVKTASTHPAYKPQYDNLTGLHKTVFSGYGIHQKDFFLPWHRWFLLQYENLLRQIDCRVTVPYWDWSLVAGNPWSSSIWNTGDDGFGGDGVPWHWCVNTGPFKESVWSLPASAGGGCLRRNFNGIVPDAITVKNAITMFSNFHEFEPLLRLDFHDGVHCSIGGTMCTSNAATAPEFFLHHGFVDKIWWDWQKSHTCKGYDFFHDQDIKMPFTPYPSRDFLDLKDQPDCVCVEYVDPKNDVYGRIKVMSQKTISKTARLEIPTLSKDAQNLFGVSETEMWALQGFEDKIKPNILQKRSYLRGKEAMLGFDSSYLY